MRVFPLREGIGRGLSGRKNKFSQFKVPQGVDTDQMFIENKSSRLPAHDGLSLKKTASCHHISDSVPVIDRGQLLPRNDLAPVGVIIVNLT